MQQPTEKPLKEMHVPRWQSKFITLNNTLASGEHDVVPIIHC